MYLASVCLCLCVQFFSLQIDFCWLAIHHIQENVCHQNEVITCRLTRSICFSLQQRIIAFPLWPFEGQKYTDLAALVA